MEMLKEKLSGISAGRVLDVGTGGGDFVDLLTTFLKEYSEIIGIDTNERAVEAARKNFNKENIKFMIMDACDMNFEDESFDTVCISNSIHHLPEPKKILDEMKRVLKPGGRLIICEMFCDNQNEKQLNHVAWHHWAAEVNRIMGVYHGSTHKKEEILDIANSLGLSKIDSFEFNFPEEEESNEDELKGFLTHFDELAEKIKDHEEYDRLYKEKERFKKSILDIGMSSATELFVIGTK